MADDSLEILEEFDFHPCNSPRGCLYYNVDHLTPEQQGKLNELKLRVVRDDAKFLAMNPECRAVVALLMRHVLKLKPRRHIHKIIAEYFKKPKCMIEEEIENYLVENNIVRYKEPVEVEGEDQQDFITKYLRKLKLETEHAEEIEGESLLPSFTPPIKIEEPSDSLEYIKQLLEETLQKMPSTTAILEARNRQPSTHSSRSVSFASMTILGDENVMLGAEEEEDLLQQEAE